MNWTKRVAALCMTLLLLVSSAAAEVQFLPQIAAWTAEELPLRLDITCEVVSEASSGEKRLAQLQALMEHMKLRVDLQELQDETWSRVGVMVDDRSAVTLCMRETPEMTLLQASPLADTTIQLAANAADPLSLLIGSATEGLSFKGMDGSGAAWLRDAEALLAKLGDTLAPYGSAKKVDTAIKNMGKARTKTTFTIPAEETAVLAELIPAACGEGELRTLLGKLTFEGKQQFLLYQDADGNILKLTYEGRCGVGEDMRKVSLSWSLRRDDDHTRDTFTLKTPAVSGTDRNSLTFTRVAKTGKNGSVTVELSARLEEVVDKQMTSWVCEADLKTAAADEGTRLTGGFTLKNTTPDDVTSKLILTPDLVLGGDIPAAAGTLTVEETRAGNTLAKVILGVTLGEGEYFNWELTGTTVQADSLTEADARSLREQLASGTATALVRHIALLPQDAAMYLFDGIDESVREQIIQIAREALQEEEAR